MGGTTMVVVIVFITVGFGVMYDMYKKHLEFKAKTLKHNSENDEEKHALTAQVQRLESRIEVLEKIVTDEGYQVQKDIRNL